VECVTATPGFKGPHKNKVRCWYLGERINGLKRIQDSRQQRTGFLAKKNGQTPGNQIRGGGHKDNHKSRLCLEMERNSRVGAFEVPGKRPQK